MAISDLPTKIYKQLAVMPALSLISSEVSLVL
jgi:hypothetical protein